MFTQKLIGYVYTQSDGICLQTDRWDISTDRLMGYAYTETGWICLQTNGMSTHTNGSLRTHRPMGCPHTENDGIHLYRPTTYVYTRCR